MITNGYCTIFRDVADGTAVSKAGVFPCMWQEVKSCEVKKYGEQNADIAAVFIPDADADIRKGDFIFFGEKDFPSDNELFSALHVHSVSENKFGSKNMHHIKLGVR